MGRLTAIGVLEGMVAMFASGDPAAAPTVVAENYIDHQGLGAEEMRGLKVSRTLSVQTSPHPSI
jgi:hypothetical protein